MRDLFFAALRCFHYASMIFRLKSLFFILVFAAFGFTTTSGPVSAKDISVSSEQIDYFSIGSSNHKIGKLTFLGGLEVNSDNKNFGGLSGLRISDDGSRIYAVSDRGFWFTAKIKRKKHGQMKKLKKAKLACLCRADGTPYGSKHWADAEGVEINGSKVYVVYERLNRINEYQLSNHLPGPPKQATTSFKRLNIAYNTGLEAMALAPSASPLSGKFIAIAEESLNANGDNRAFIASSTSIEEFSILRSDDYSITDASFLPNGDLLILERRFGLSVGLGMRIRRIAADLIEPNAKIEGEVIMEAGLTSRIDNMEGIATWQTETGETRIVLISDDNYNKRLQRTLLLEFRLEE